MKRPTVRLLAIALGLLAGLVLAALVGRSAWRLGELEEPSPVDAGDGAETDAS